MNTNKLDYFANIQNVLDRHTNIELAYVFGSIANGTATPNSDLDVAIQTFTQLGVQAKIQFIAELAATTSRIVNPIDLCKAGKSLLGETLRNMIRLTGTNKAHGEY
jgi:uncharacterized protein